MTTAGISLDPQRRGTEFRYSSALVSPWTADMFDGGILFTVRTRLPASSITSDEDADVVAQVSVDDDGVTFTSTTAFTVLIPGSVTTTWPTGRLVWDMQGVITAAPEDRVLDIAAGTVVVVADVTRTQPEP